MRKVKKIMDIPVQEISFTDGSPAAVEICDIRHTPVHSHHALIEMILCLRGSISIICNQEHLVLKKGELFSVGFDDLHCIYSDEENITVSFYMDMKKMHLPWETLKYTDSVLSCSIAQKIIRINSPYLRCCPSISDLHPESTGCRSESPSAFCTGAG